MFPLMQATLVAANTFDVAIVTGAGSGIGRALAAQLAYKRVHVIAVGRRAEAVEKTAIVAFQHIWPLSADVSVPSGREQIAMLAMKLSANGKIALVHNAAVTGELKTVNEGFDIERFRETMAINVEAPLFLTQRLRPLMAPGSRILHVSSGGAHQGVGGMLPYCASKAALFSIYEALRDELAHESIWIGSAMPGVVDTPMQESLARSDPSWPMHSYFSELRARTIAPSLATEAYGTSGQCDPPPQEGLNTPASVARFLQWLLMETNDAEFIANEWDIADRRHTSRWCFHNI
eukprot:CAMPEP_0119339118 /NCGR_PEP_ID=MMETSP1333-20130426/97621_1 /TAXON_ID=418940 /ORGANISM="Scyphosphaera apsteinii, Strain RCC1455" /LENGTH=290 /DNA_ID=CAMNT_0007350593 /DNA_START=88 /DNA_END=960 /DNA_ORIENTATION=+